MGDWLGVGDGGGGEWKEFSVFCSFLSAILCFCSCCSLNLISSYEKATLILGEDIVRGQTVSSIASKAKCSAYFRYEFCPLRCFLMWEQRGTRVAKNWTGGNRCWEGLSEILADSLPQVSFQEQEGPRRCFWICVWSQGHWWWGGRRGEGWRKGGQGGVSCPHPQWQVGLYAWECKLESVIMTVASVYTALTKCFMGVCYLYP